MKDNLIVGNLTAEAGTRQTGYITVPTTNIQMPVILLNGAQTGKTLLITAGIHGGEYPCIEAGIRLSCKLNPAEMSGQIIILPIVSLHSFHARQAFFVPEDGKNLNRQFPGKALGTTSERMAHAIMTQVVPQADAWIDLHGGDIPEALVPFLGYIESPDVEVQQTIMAMAEVFGIEIVVQPGHLPGTSISAGVAAGVPSLLAEAGQLGRLDEADTLLLQQGCENVARLLGILPGEAPRYPLREFKKWPWVRAEHTGCWYPQVAVGETVSEGQVVGVMRDYFGNLLAEYHAPVSGLVLLVCAALAVNVNDPLVGVATN